MRALLASLLFLVLAAGFAAAAPLQILANDSIAEQTTTSSTQVPAANITFTPQGGNNNRCYLLMASGEVSQSNANNEVRVNFTVDSLTIGTSNFEPQSTASYYSVAFHNVTCFADQNAHDATLYFSRDATTAAIRNARVIALGINNSADYIANFTIPKTLTTGNVYRPYLNLTFTVPSSGTHNYLLLGSLEFDHGATAVASSIIVRFQLDNVVIAESNFSGQSGNAVGAFTFMAHNVSTLSAGSHKLNISVMQAGGTAGLIRRVRLTVVNLTGYSYAANESVPVKKDTAASYLPVTSVSMPFIFNKDFIALASSVASTSATSARVRNILFPPYDLAPSWRTTVDVAIANENFSFFALWNDTWDSASEPEHLMNLSHGSEDGSTEIRTGHASISVIWVPLSCGTLTASTTLDIDLTTTGTCFTIGADSITLDCNGHTITGSGSTAGSGFGVMNTQYDNVVIRNCVITNFEKGIYFTGASDNAIFINDTISAVTEGVYVNISSTPRMWNLSITSPSRAGILLNRSNWGGIFNTTVDSTSVLPLTELYDIYLYMSNFSFIHNVTVATSQFLAQSYGIALESSNTTTISNYSSPQSETGLYIFLSNMTRVENSSLDQFSAYGIFLSSSNNSFIRNVTLNNGSIGPVLSGTGIYLSGSWFNLFQNLSVWNNSGPGATISLSNNNSFENSSFRRNAWSVAGGSGVSLSSSSNNTFWNITVEDQSGATGNTGIDLISSSNDNRFLNVTSRNNSAGFNFTASDRNLIVNSTAANNSYGVYFS
ncbi:MAG: right-handed parallel beta-helix repeat-containing protein, partial [Candidatus Burarchaeum sp.]